MGDYAYCGNLLVLHYTLLDNHSIGTLNWIDPETKTKLRSTILATNLGATPAGSQFDFHRMK